MKKLLLLLACISPVYVASAQGLLDELENDTTKPPTTEYAIGTFKAHRIINGHSVEMPGKGELSFIIAHRFGRLNSGFYEMLGWDQATIRLGLEYTLPFYDRICLGVGRSSYNKTWDGFVKYKVFRQSKGAKKMPFTIDLFASIAINGLKWADPKRPNYFSSRLSYAFQIMIARKFNERFSMQLTPSLMHKNLVPKREDANTFFALGAGMRIKVSKRISINAEYFWLVPGQNLPEVFGQRVLGPLAVGIDWETGGHVFQLHVTNAQAMFEQGFIGETTGDVSKGDIHFGFNISRSLTFKKGGSKYKTKEDRLKEELQEKGLN